MTSTSPTAAPALQQHDATSRQMFGRPDSLQLLQPGEAAQLSHLSDTDEEDDIVRAPAAQARALAKLWSQEPDFEMVWAAGMVAHTSPRGQRQSLADDGLAPGFERLGVPPSEPQPAIPTSPEPELDPTPRRQLLALPRERTGYRLRGHNSMPAPYRTPGPRSGQERMHSDIDAAVKSDSLLISVGEAARRRRSTGPHNKGQPHSTGSQTSPERPSFDAQLEAARSSFDEASDEEPATHIIVQALLSPTAESSASQSPGHGPHYAGTAYPFDEQPLREAMSPRPSSSVSLLPLSPHSVAGHLAAMDRGESASSSLSRSWQPAPAPEQPPTAGPSLVHFGPPPRRTRQLLGLRPERRAQQSFDDQRAQQESLRLAERMALQADCALAELDVVPAASTPVFAEVLKLHSTSWTLLLLSEPSSSRTHALAHRFQRMEGIVDRLRQLTTRPHGAIEIGDGRRALLQLERLATETSRDWTDLLQLLDRPEQRPLRQAVLHKGVSLICFELEVLGQLPCAAVRERADDYLPSRRRMFGASVMTMVAPLRINLFGVEFGIPRLRLSDAVPLARHARPEHHMNRAMWFEITRHWRALADFGAQLIDQVPYATQLIEDVQPQPSSTSLTRLACLYDDLALESEQGMVLSSSSALED